MHYLAEIPLQPETLTLAGLPGGISLEVAA
jgi:hypothetical protein